MDLPSPLRGRAGAWNGAIIASAAAAILTNGIGLAMGGSGISAPLLVIPVVIGAYRYPRQALILAGGTGLAYLALVILLTGVNSPHLPGAVAWAAVLAMVGWLVGVLSLRLRTQEERYRGLFDHSEAGSILVREVEGERTVEEANWSAAQLLSRSLRSLEGAPLTSFWDREEEASLFSRLAREGRVYAEETIFRTPEGSVRRVLVSIAVLPPDRAVVTCVDITRMVAAEEALRTANEKLALLSRISTDHLHRSANDIIETVDLAMDEAGDAHARSLFARIRLKAWDLARQIFLAESYQDLGVHPPGWIRVHEVHTGAPVTAAGEDVSVRSWTERLEVSADPLFRDVFSHIVENAVRYGAPLKNIVISHRQVAGGLELIIEDDGRGVPDDRKESIFAYDAGQHASLGLFVCRQILGVTGMTITENGTPGKGARFVIGIPDGNWRIEGATDNAPPFSASAPVTGAAAGTTTVRELRSAEFPLADELWVDYHETKGDPGTDRVFAAFAGGRAVSLARCRRHPDGLEVDAVFTPVANRGHGYANHTVSALVEACGHEPLFMHSVLNLTGFYGRYGFVPIREEDLPATIRERFAWAGGALEGANVLPMRRDPSS
ncbi:MAG: ATP-binding protein [Methanoregulaceae archaeon]|jgi:PAS domain S-box-containing protein